MVTVALLHNQREDQKMKTIVLTVVLVTAFLAADLLPSEAQSAELLYQKGLMNE